MPARSNGIKATVTNRQGDTLCSTAIEGPNVTFDQLLEQLKHAPITKAYMENWRNTLTITHITEPA